MDALMEKGLRANHCYSILSVHEIKSLGKKVRLLKLRNPWGLEEWNGEWSDDSPLWNDALLNECKHEIGNDGTFLICIDDYIKNFSFTNICKYVYNNVHNYAFKNTNFG